MSDQYYDDDDDEPITLVNEQGEQIGVRTVTDAGEVVDINLDGDVWDAQTGEYYGVLDEDGDVIAPDPADEYDERLAELEARANEPRDVEYVLPVEPTDEVDDLQDLSQQADAIERMLDRPLTIEERRRLSTEAMTDLDAGQRADLIEAADRLDLMGEPLLDLDSGHRGNDHAARVELITSRLNDTERIEDAYEGYDDLMYPEPPQTQAEYDLDDRSERQAYLADRVRGSGADPGDTYSSSDLPPDYYDEE